MKISITGKGGVGKTTVAAILARMLAEEGHNVVAVDADPDANLAAALGFPKEIAEGITPISELKDLIEERTGTKEAGTFFKLNPKVDDIPDRFGASYHGVKLLIMGKVKGGGSGCYCPENTLLRALTTHLLLSPNQDLILDMEAGIEHLSRGTARAVDTLICVVEPGQRSIQTAERIRKLAVEMGIDNVAVIGNKIRDQQEKDFIESSLPDFKILGYLPYDPQLGLADRTGQSAYGDTPVREEMKRIVDGGFQVTTQPQGH
ncbi:MAG: carbon monoxide dehydrogenase accessory protein CooC [bacterium]